MHVIGIGDCGEAICTVISKYKKIKTTILKGGKGLPLCETHEEYEANVPKLGNKLRLGKEQDVWVIVSGSSKCSGAILRILEQIKDREVKVVYINPESFFLSEIKKKQHRLTYGVLQEYARSGLINSLWLFDNKTIGQVVGEGTLRDYYKNTNDAIANVLMNILWFKETKPLMGSFHEAKDISRICSVSVGNIENHAEKDYFLLDNITETCYLYSISKQDIKENKDLVPIIRTKILNEQETKQATFGIWENAHKHSFFYSVKYTHFIQNEKK
jgi:hypothetical protein